MAKGDIDAMRTGIKTALDAITGLRTSAYRIDKINPPMAVVDIDAADYDEAMQRGVDQIPFKVTLFAGRAFEVPAQKLLDDFLSKTGARSIKTALQVDRTFGGACDTSRVTKRSGYLHLIVAALDYIACEWTIEAYTS